MMMTFSCTNMYATNLDKTSGVVEIAQTDHAVFEVTTNNLSVVRPEIIEGNKLKLYKDEVVQKEDGA